GGGGGGAGVSASAPGTRVPPYRFSPEDERLLTEVQRGSFNFFWTAGDPVSGMAPDRASEPRVASIAGVGFQLSALCVGVERGFVTRAEGEGRALSILRTLAENPTNRKHGLFYHFLDSRTGGQPPKAYEHVVSTIDSALFFCGAMTAAEYFGGEVQRVADGLLREADWAAFVSDPATVKPHERGFVTLGWKPTSLSDPTGAGGLLPYAWIDSGDEHRMVTFLAVAAEKRPLPAETYYRLRRGVGALDDGTPVVWFPWSGALFVQIFAHCFIDYAHMGTDDPAAFGVKERARVDWWENARRTVRLHRERAIEHSGKIATFGPDSWGLSASDVKSGYAVPGLFPRPVRMIGATAEMDYPVANTQAIRDNLGDGTIAPYAAGSSIMFEPEAAMAALRHYRGLAVSGTTDRLWHDPSQAMESGPGRGKPGYGFADSFNLKTGWVAADFVAIDQGPLILAIENARSGLLWRLFHEHGTARRGLERLGSRVGGAPGVR
ncbi:MAG: glucoamylase family protein, partial [Phycisphaerales bacterium]